MNTIFTVIIKYPSINYKQKYEFKTWRLANEFIECVQTHLPDAKIEII